MPFRAFRRPYKRPWNALALATNPPLLALKLRNDSEKLYTLEVNLTTLLSSQQEANVVRALVSNDEDRLFFEYPA